MDATQTPPAPYPAALDVQHVTRRFGSLVAVDDISFRVPFNETILGIIGPSGSGKTTLVRMLTGALRPTNGQVRVLGEDPALFRRATRERIGYLPQLFSLYPELTVKENVNFVASLFGMLWRRRRSRVKKVLELVALTDVRNRRAGRLSGGMQRRLELACALVNEPALLVLDEPTAGIDPLLRVTIWDELRRLRNDGRILLVTTQVVAEAERCDAVALVADGRLIALAPPTDLRRMATGGDVIEIELAQPIDPGILFKIPNVRHVTQDSPLHVRVTVDDAGLASPAVVDAISSIGGDVRSVRETRPSFDEVFAVLVTRHRQQQDQGTTGARDAPASKDARIAGPGIAA
jgi:ABC-2 type transport system ATP-binding protein